MSVVLNILPDIVISIVVYTSLFSFLSHKTTLKIAEVGEICFLASILFLSIPLMLPVTSRMKAFNGRTLGSLYSFIYFVSTAFFIESGGWYWGVTAGVAVFFTIISSLFGMQVILFFGLLMSIFYLNIAPVATVLLVVAIGFVIPPLGIRDVVIFKIEHYLWYKKEKNKGTTAMDRNLFVNFFLFFFLLFKSPHKAISLLIRKSPLLIVVYSLPILWIFFYLFTIPGIRADLFAEPVNKFCTIMILNSGILFLITSTEWFSEWGQAERYFEYSAPMLVFLTILLGVDHSIITSMLLVNIIVIQICIIIVVQLLSNPNMVKNLLINNLGGDHEDINLADFLNGISGEVKVATLPIKLPIELSAYTSRQGQSRIKFYYRLILGEKHRFSGFRYFQNDTESLNMFCGVPEDLKTKYGIEYLVADKDYLNNVNSGFASVLKQYDIIYSNQKYDVFKI